MNPQAHRSTEELKTIVKALSKLSLLNTPEEDQRLFECEQELRKRKREDDFINAHFQVATNFTKIRQFYNFMSTLHHEDMLLRHF